MELKFGMNGDGGGGSGDNETLISVGGGIGGFCLANQNDSDQSVATAPRLGLFSLTSRFDVLIQRDRIHPCPYRAASFIMIADKNLELSWRRNTGCGALCDWLRGSKRPATVSILPRLAAHFLQLLCSSFVAKLLCNRCANCKVAEGGGPRQC